MKKIFLIIIGFVFFSCSDDNEVVDEATSNFTNALPLKTGNYWTYDVLGGTATRDSLYIFGDETIAPNTYKKFKNRNDLATGFYSSSLNNNLVRKDNGKLLLTGSFNVSQVQVLPIGLDLSVVDFIIFKESATDGELLNEKTGAFQQTVNNIPLNIEYKLKAVGGTSIDNFTSPNNDVYTNVKTTKIVINLKITTTQTIAGIPFTVTVLQPQDVVTSTQYLSKNIGVVYAKTLTAYNLDSAIASQIGIPASNSETQEEFLDTYDVD